MIFWIFVILTLVAIGINVATSVASNKYIYGKEDNKWFVTFVHHNEDTICLISAIIASILGIITIAMLVCIVQVHTSAEGYRASNEQRYQALIYKAQTESIRDEFGIVNKEYIDEIQSWNEDVVMYQTFSDSFWIGIFFPKDAYDGFETINLEDIRMNEQTGVILCST